MSNKDKKLEDFINESLMLEREMEARIWDNAPCSANLEELVSKQTKESLVDLGCFFNIYPDNKACKAYKKDIIVEKIRDSYVQAVEDYLINMETSQFTLLSKAARAKKGYILWKDIKNEYDYVQINYFVDRLLLIPIKVDDKNALTMPDEIKNIFKRKRSDELKVIHDINFARRQIFYGMLHFYGILHVADFVRILIIASDKIEPFNIDNDIKELASYEKLITLEDYYAIGDEVPEEEISEIFKGQALRKNIDYKIYSIEDYYKASISGNVPLNEYSEKLLSKFNKIFCNEDLAVESLKTTHLMFRMGMDPEDAVEFLKHLQSEFSYKIDFEDLLQLLTNVYDNTPQWRLKGYTPIEIFKKNKKVLKKVTNNVIDMRTRTKVGLNDPCPCGSGKKYKNCCGEA